MEDKVTFHGFHSDYITHWLITITWRQFVRLDRQYFPAVNDLGRNIMADVIGDRGDVAVLLTSIALRVLNLLSRYLPLAVFDPFLRILPYACLGFICFACDSLFTSVRERVFLRAVVDNASHGIIAFVSWWIVSKFHYRKNILEAVFCGMIACGVDVDHFIAAKSIKLEDALRLTSRPFLHTTTIVFIIVPILQVWFAQNNPFLRSLPYLFTVAVISHHLRDGNRRGVWFWPLGNTYPLPYWMYISFTMALPFMIKEVKRVIDRLPAISVSNGGVPLIDV